jgi:hypothetical protein
MIKMLASCLLSTLTMTVPSTGVLCRNNWEAQFEAYIAELYGECGLDDALDYRVFRYAMTGYYNMRTVGLLSDKEILTIIDYTKSGNDKRFFVIDLARLKVLYRTLVAHGMNTGNLYAEHFSNEPGSKKSSIGFYVTGETYYGKHGYSLKLDGVDTVFNGNARKREIVIHGARYVSNEWTKTYGRIGRSWGCPALPQNYASEIIDTIKAGCCLFAYYDNVEYLQSTQYLNTDTSITQHIMMNVNAEQHY